MRVRFLLIALAPIVYVPSSARAQSPADPDPLAPRLAEGPLATGLDELNATFTSDGKTVYFTRKVGGRFGVILVSHLRAGRWTGPEVAPFSGQFSDFDPILTPDGSRLLWISNRPVDDRPRADFDIWMVERRADGWSPPIHLDAPVNSDAEEYFPSVAANGALYFTSTRAGGHGRGDLYRSLPDGARWSTPVGLGERVNTSAFEGDAFVAPDERYIIFAAYGRPDGDAEGDLFISMNRDGTWDTPRRLGHGINTGAREYAPVVTPDGRWLYFASYRGVTDAPRSRPFTSEELRDVAEGPFNGYGSVYRVPIEAIR